MDRLLQVDRDTFVKQMREEVDGVLREVMDAVNAAPDGQVINRSEAPVRDLMARLRERVYEQAVQMRIDETERFFPPSPRLGGKSPAEQGT